MATVYVPTTMRKLTDGQAMITLAGDTVGQLFQSLEARYPGTYAQVCDEQGQFKRHVAIFVNGKDIRTLSQGETHLTEQDEVYIVPAIAGGSTGA